MEWISVKDKLPENDTRDYLIVRHGDVDIETWHYRGGHQQGFWYDYLNITHWMPLPKPPTP